jgi:hypothetical protein
MVAHPTAEAAELMQGTPQVGIAEATELQALWAFTNAARPAIKIGVNNFIVVDSLVLDLRLKNVLFSSGTDA